MATEENIIHDSNNINQEYQLLGILLQFPETIDEVADALQVKHFLNPQAQLIYELLLNQFQQDSSISRTKLFLRLKKDGITKNPEETIEHLTSGFNTLEELKPTIEIIKKNYQQQLLLKAAGKIKDLAQDSDLKIGDYQARAQEIIFEATNENTDINKHIFTMEEALMDSFKAYVDRKHNRADIGLRSGFISLDNLIGGFKKGHLIVLAASTSMGKTAFALNIARNIIKRDVPVAVISLEMDAREIVDRMIIQESGVHGWKYTQGETNEGEDRKISRALDKLHELPLLISDERGLNVAQIRARLRKFKSQYGKMGLAIIDYLQMIQILEDNYNNTAR
ncbi:MAG TPA: DnaB-like helicase C-terminal domain-containing protein, partial [Halanaerobiales bacterium]|nr:DnaB-like helicase C-terminal domain-containing protein [Halanaerobiales bacterium]